MSSRRFVIVPFQQKIVALARVIKNHRRTVPGHKVIVFFPTARETQFYAA